MISKFRAKDRGCRECGALIPVQLTGRPRVFCAACRPASSPVRPVDWRASVCEFCGVSITSGKRGPSARFCSRSCAAKSARRARAPEKTCAHCGSTINGFHARLRFCSPTCRSLDRYAKTQAAKREAYYASGDDIRTCSICGCPFRVDFGAVDFSRKTCTAECAEANRKRLVRTFDAIYGARRRAKVRESGERIDPVAVIVRAGCRCQICGAGTPLSLRGKHRPTSPEIDHIVPLSRGGRHISENVQCACRQCNNTKSNRLNLAA